jgi:hypothetical protein
VDLQQRRGAGDVLIRNDLPLDDRRDGQQDAAAHRNRVDAHQRALLCRGDRLRNRGVGCSSNTRGGRRPR